MLFNSRSLVACTPVPIGWWVHDFATLWLPPGQAADDQGRQQTDEKARDHLVQIVGVSFELQYPQYGDAKTEHDASGGPL